MEITTDLIKHLANLSRLKFTDSEIEGFKKEFEKTMEYVNTLQQVDTSKIKADSRALNAQTELRDDEPKSFFTQQEAIQEAPEKASGMIVVPKMVD